jgi:glycosyltransferase 2 family protein
MEETKTKKVAIKDSFLSWRTLIGFVIAGFVVYLFLKKFNLTAAISSISSANIFLLLMALVAFYSSLPLRGLRWNILLRPSNIAIGWKPLSHYYFLSWFANAILPARIGDIYRAYLLKKNNDIPVSLSLGVIFSERIIDLAVTAILLVLSGSYFWGSLKNSEESAYLFWGIVLIVGLIALFVITFIALPWITKLAPQSLKSKLELFRAGIFKWPALLPGITLITITIWLSEALRLYLVLLAFGIKSGFLLAVFISQASLILMALPISPAGLGLVELLMLKLLTSSEISLSLAGAITLTDRLISYWSLVIFGGIVYILSARKR